MFKQMSMLKLNLNLFFFLLVVSTNSYLNAQKRMLYPNLERGKYDIGFRTIIDFDISRTYNLQYPIDTTSVHQDSRPIIINMWYPANLHKEDKAMIYGDYIKVKTQNVKLKNFINRIESYNLKNSSFYMFYSDSMSEEQKKLFAKQLKQPIDVFRNATPVIKKFPLVIYHPGLGSPLSDNTILCEYLASHGFVVITGAFEANDYKEVHLDWNLERSTKDIDFMLNKIKGLPFIDFSRIAAIGHSYGAQAVLGYKTEDFSPVSCLISLDNTIDYSLDVDVEGYKPLTDKLFGKINNMNVPILVFAKPSAAFLVIDSLKKSDRTFATINLKHNEYTSLTSYAIMNGLQKRNDADSVWHKYTLINNYCLNYLRYNFYNDTTAKNFILSKQPLLNNVQEIPKGQSLNAKIPYYSDYSEQPSYFQKVKILKDKKKEMIDTIMQKYPDAFEEEDINNAGYSYMKKDIDFAIYLFQKNVEAHPKSWNVFDSLGEAYMIKGEKELAIKYYKKSIELNPQNDSGIQMLEKLK